jgi:hypothetical protein
MNKKTRKALIWSVPIIGLFFLIAAFVAAVLWSWACSRTELVTRIDRDNSNTNHRTD